MARLLRKMQKIDENLPTGCRYKILRLSIITLFVSILGFYHCKDMDIRDLLYISRLKNFLEYYFVFCNSSVATIFALKVVTIYHVLYLRMKNINGYLEEEFVDKVKFLIRLLCILCCCRAIRC